MEYLPKDKHTILPGCVEKYCGSVSLIERFSFERETKVIVFYHTRRSDRLKKPRGTSYNNQEKPFESLDFRPVAIPCVGNGLFGQWPRLDLFGL